MQLWYTKPWQILIAPCGVIFTLLLHFYLCADKPNAFLWWLTSKTTALLYPPGQGGNNGELGRLYPQSLDPTHAPCEDCLFCVLCCPITCYKHGLYTGGECSALIFHATAFLYNSSDLLIISSAPELSDGWMINRREFSLRAHCIYHKERRASQEEEAWIIKTKKWFPCNWSSPMNCGCCSEARLCEGGTYVTMTTGWLSQRCLGVMLFLY